MPRISLNLSPEKEERFYKFCTDKCLSHPNGLTFLVADYFDRLDNPLPIQQIKSEKQLKELSSPYEPYLQEIKELGESGKEVLIVYNVPVAEMLEKEHGYECVEVRSAKPDIGLLKKRWILRKIGSRSMLPPPDPYPRGKQIVPNHELLEIDDLNL